MPITTNPQATDPQNNPSHSQLHRDEIEMLNTLETDKADDNIVVKLTGEQTVAGEKTFSDGCQFNKGAIFTGVRTPWITGIGDYIALYKSDTHGLRILGYNGVDYKPLVLGNLFDTNKFNLTLNVDGTSSFGSDVLLPTGKTIKINGVALKDVTETLTNKTLTLPTFTNGTINFNAPQGFLINGKIVRTVDGSGNMTVAIKTLAGNDPSATDPVYCRIGNTVRSITSALFVNINAGFSWCNAGSAELATKEIDYFVKLSWCSNASAVRISFTRIPTTEWVWDSYTNTEKALIINDNTEISATDEFELIGRFNATLSAGPTYTWSIPATDIIINRWENSSEFHTWNLTLSGGTTTPTFGINNNRYKIVGNRCIGSIVLVNTSGGTAGSGEGEELVLKLPFSAKSSNYLNDGIGYYLNNAVSIPVSLTHRADIGTDCFILNNMGRNVILPSAFNSADRGIYINFDYEI